MDERGDWSARSEEPPRARQIRNGVLGLTGLAFTGLGSGLFGLMLFGSVATTWPDAVWIPGFIVAGVCFVSGSALMSLGLHRLLGRV